MKKEKKKILIIQTGKLGDMVCTTPMFRAIKKHHSDCLLYVLGDSLNKQVLNGNPHIDAYIEIHNFSQEFLREQLFDTAILLNPNPAILWKLLKARILNIIASNITNGFSPLQTKTYRILLFFVTKSTHRMRYYAPQEYLNTLQSIGVYTEDTNKELYIDPIVLEKVNRSIASYKDTVRIAIAPGAGNKIKEWPPEKFSQLIIKLHNKYKTTFFIIGGKQEEKIRDTILSSTTIATVVDTVGKLSIEELKSYIKNMDLFISADTGPIYIAEAFDIPTVDIIGPIDEQEQPPRGEKHISVIPPNRKKPEMFVMNARIYNLEEASRLAFSTPVDSVVEASDILLKKFYTNYV